jgi:uncharacterized protein (DUF2126 family)/transglutaminase-like putative cysteine protease
MAIRVSIFHQTLYHYKPSTALSPQVIRLRPAPHCRSDIVGYSLNISPEEHFVNWQQDPFSNWLARIVFPERVQHFHITVDLVVDLSPINPFDFFLTEEAEEMPVIYDEALKKDLAPYLETMKYRPIPDPDGSDHIIHEDLAQDELQGNEQGNEQERAPFESSLPNPTSWRELFLQLKHKLGYLLIDDASPQEGPTPDDTCPPQGDEKAIEPGADASEEVIDDRELIGAKFEALLKELEHEKDIRTVDHLVRVNAAINERLDYTLRMEPGVQTPEETLELGKGSCRDFAWLLVQILRHQGLAARFVSGYSVQLKADEKPIEGPAGVQEDIIDLHAWVEVYLPGAGWVGLDPTSGMFCTEGHIPLAASPDPSQASPIEGGLTKCEVEFEHRMTVSRIHEDPRVTKPFQDGEWQKILKLGDQIDQRIKKEDMRLTMGGEPTFVSVDDYEAEEWNSGAVGKDKFEKSMALTKALMPNCGQDALLHCGQGKWYPGESLPRWAMAIYWRKDGQPIWCSPKYLADPSQNLGHTPKDAQRFLATLALHLKVNIGHICPALEDVIYYIWKEGKLPKDVDVIDNKLKNEEDRERLRRVFEEGLGHPVGYILPIQKAQNQDLEWTWQSGLWMLRGQTKDKRNIVLIPGDSPIGLRLPLDSISHHVPQPFLHGDDPSQAELQELMDAQQIRKKIQSHERAQEIVEQELAKEGETPAGPEIRTAMAVQPRDGTLRLFMPPLRTLEDYLELLAAIEATCNDCDLSIVIEGYTPPQDPRIDVLKVTPDPGVIEVNVAPAKNWRELVHNTKTLYETAKQCRLGTEKFMVDGRHTGTGGGNHIVVGAGLPAESPFLRRPDLLRSVISYWNNHPAMSYLFSGMFIGPTSQAPRLDEGRVDAVDELELANLQFNCLDRPQAWMVDRWYRNLLTDLTGNTHRSEICIDKLYSPDSTTGRLGLVEFRGFEMPPHAEMSLVQQLLIRSILLMLWERPYTQKLARWGKELHNKFLLPYHIRRDFETILHDLQLSGISMAEHWFNSHFEFRFPVAGTVTVDGMNLELRHAIEPWNVLGEEPGAGGTVRSVDSSMEKLQISVDHFNTERYALAVNGYQLPLKRGLNDGEYFIGLKFRAWQPPHCLHPAIPVHTPLVFDIIDIQEQKSIGGCRYHASHPGGASYEDRPVNALSAEARRKERFTSHGHTPGRFSLFKFPDRLQHCDTIDLRYATVLS